MERVTSGTRRPGQPYLPVSDRETLGKVIWPSGQSSIVPAWLLECCWRLKKMDMEELGFKQHQTCILEVTPFSFLLQEVVY